GPKTAHAYEKNARVEVNKRIDEIVEKGAAKLHEKIQFTTYTLRYNHCDWVLLTGLGKHWERAKVEGEVKDRTANLKTENVTEVLVLFTEDQFPKGQLPTRVEIDGAALPLTIVKNGIVTDAFEKKGGKWQPSMSVPDGMTKTLDHQGPIDDAFMDSFIN